MARVFEVNRDEFAALAGGRPTARGMQFLSRQFDMPSQVLSDAGRRFMQKATDAFNAFDYDAIIGRVEAITRTVSHMWDRDSVAPLFGIGALQQARPQMQRWLMAMPSYREEYHRGLVSGFRGEYVDNEPGSVGELHSDYRRVMNGMPRFDDEGNNYYVTYPDTFEDGLEELTLAQKDNVLSSWDELAYHHAQRGRDPGDPWNGKL